MAVKIRLARRGGKNESRWRVVVTHQPNARDGKFIEILGFYHPGHPVAKEKLQIKQDRVQYWLGKGAQPSEVIRKYLGVVGILPEVDFSGRVKRKPKGEQPTVPTLAPAAPVPVEPKAEEVKVEQPATE